VLESIFSEVIILSSVVVGGSVAIMFARHSTRNNPLNTKERNRYLNYIADLESENKKLKGKVNQAKKPVSIDEFDEDNPMGAISELIQVLTPILPASVRPFLANPNVLKGAQKLIEEHPEEIKNVLSKFVSKNGKKGKEESSTTDDVISV
jgi:hypothetical protein